MLQTWAGDCLPDSDAYPPTADGPHPGYHSILQA